MSSVPCSKEKDNNVKQQQTSYTNMIHQHDTPTDKTYQ